MNAYALSCILAGGTSFWFSFFVLFKSSNRSLAKIWFLFACSVAVYGFVTSGALLTKSSNTAFILWKIAYIVGVIWIAPFFYHFICTFLEIKRSSLIRINYLIACVFCIIGPTRLFFTHIAWVFDSFYYTQAGPAFKAYLLWWMLIVVYSHYLLWKAYGRVSIEKKSQILYFFLATTIGFTGGSLAYLPQLGIMVYPWGNFMVFLYPIIMSYAILKHRLMDITVVIRKTLLYSFVTAGLASIYAGLITLVAYLIGTNDQIPFISASSNVLHGITFHWLVDQIQLSFSYACLVTALSSICLGAFVYMRGKRKPVNIIWFFTCLAISMWSFGLGMMVRSTNFPEAYFWSR